MLTDDESAGAELETDCINPVDETQLSPSADCSTTFLVEPESETHGASKLQLNMKSTQQSMGYLDLNVTRGMEDAGSSALPRGNPEGGDDTPTKRINFGAPVSKNRVLDSALPEPQDDQAAASLHQSDLTNERFRKRLRQSAPRDVRREGHPTVASIKSRARVTIPDQEREVGHVDQEEDSDSSTDDPDDEDYSDTSNAAVSRRRGSRHLRKRARRTKDSEHNVESLSTPSFDNSSQSAAATLPGSIHKSEQIPVHGFLTLKTVGSKIVYCLTFSQELLPCSTNHGHRQLRTTNPEKPHSIAPDSVSYQASLQHQTTRRPWTPKEDAKVRRMKKEGHSWEEIHAALPHRTKGTLQVRYSTKLKSQ